MENVLALLDKLQGLAFNLIGVWFALHERAHSVGWSRAIRGAFRGCLGCYLLAALLILAGQLIQIANEKVPKPAPAPAPDRVKSQPEARVKPAKPAPVALQKPLNLAPFAWAIFFVPFFWLLINETFFSTFGTADRSFDSLWNRLAPLIECNSQALTDRAVMLAFRALHTVAIVIPVLIFAEKLVRWFR